MADLNKAVSMDSSQAKYYIAVSDIYLKQNDITRAVSVLQKGLEVQPDNVPLLLLLSKYYFYANEHAQSIRTVDKVLKLDVYNPQAYFLKGMIFKEKGDTSKSISNFQTAVEQDPKM
jgi:tetratricopeptide (TPR) repeat protein